MNAIYQRTKASNERLAAARNFRPLRDRDPDYTVPQSTLHLSPALVPLDIASNNLQLAVNDEAVLSLIQPESNNGN